MKEYTIIFKQYTRVNPVLDDISAIYVGNKCIVAKNHKEGGLYLNKNAKILKGKFHHSYGSNNYPVLMPLKDVHIKVMGEITESQISELALKNIEVVV